VPLRIGVADSVAAPAMVTFLGQQAATTISAVADPVAAIRQGEVDVVIRPAADYATKLASASPAVVELFYDGASSRAIASADRARRLVAGFGRDVADSRLLLRGLVPDVAQPIELRERDVSTAAERSGRLLAMIPVFLLVAAFAGGMGVAIDSTAGERERKSLESLLLHPVSPAAIVGGKWGAAALVSGGVIALMVAMTALTLRLPQVRALDLPVGLSIAEALLLVAVLLPLAAVAPAVQMLASVSAASYKEAQTQVSLLLLLPTVPGFLFAFGTLQDGSWMRLIPVAAQQLIVSDILAGRTTSAVAVAASGVVTVMAGLAALAITCRRLTHERVAPGQRA
jgi:sodium transport system permease protein